MQKSRRSSPKNEAIELQQIGQIISPYKEKFGTPRQPGLIDEISAFVEIFPPYNELAAWLGLEEFSHIWIQFIFHQVEKTHWKPQVRPPRLGGNKRIGVFASRSPFRPNRLGLSVVKLIQIQQEKGKLILEISCPDLVDGTPIVDIKPYVHYCDSIPDAKSGFANHAPATKSSIRFENAAEDYLSSLPETRRTYLRSLITQTLRLDPRPAYKNGDDDKVYGILLAQENVKWTILNGVTNVIEIKLVD